MKSRGAGVAILSAVPFSRSSATPHGIAVAFMLGLVGITAWQVCRIPIQVSDSVGNLLQIQHQPMLDLVVGQFSNGA